MQVFVIIIKNDEYMTDPVEVFANGEDAELFVQAWRDEWENPYVEIHEMQVRIGVGGALEDWQLGAHSWANSDLEEVTE